MLRLILVLTLFLTQPLFAQTKSLRLYLDADRSHNTASARAIEIGLRGAFETVGGQVQGHNIEFALLDHRANARRTQKHLEQFVQDPQAIAVIGGLHSPPYLKAKEYVNETGIPLFLPWSAAAPLTRNGDSPNSIFRLSLDDSIAADIIVPYALSSAKCQSIALLLWESGWGKSNEKSMTRAFQERQFQNFSTIYFPSGLKQIDALSIAFKLETLNSDCAILVGNAPEGATLLRAINQAGLKIKLLSHWGITGGDFEKEVPSQMRDTVELEFIQPCFDFTGRTEAAAAQLKAMQSAYPDFDETGYLPAPAGLFHGYDLGLLLIDALGRIDLSQPISDLRKELLAAMHQIDGPVSGLLRDYEQPFTPASSATPNAHEALEITDFCMARFDGSDRIVPRQN